MAKYRAEVKKVYPEDPGVTLWTSGGERWDPDYSVIGNPMYRSKGYWALHTFKQLIDAFGTLTDVAPGTPKEGGTVEGAQYTHLPDGTIAAAVGGQPILVRDDKILFAGVEEPVPLKDVWITRTILRLGWGD